MATLCKDFIFGRKLLQWNKEVKASIQMGNVDIGKKGGEVRESYLSLVGDMSLRYNVATQLQEQIANIPLLTKDMESIREEIEEICSKIDQLNDFYMNALTDKHNAQIRFEKEQQSLHLAKEEQKYKNKLDEATQKEKESHSILKMKEIAQRKYKKHRQSK